MDIFQFIDKVEDIWEEIEKLEAEAPRHCSAMIAIMRRCMEELGEYYYGDKQVKPK